MTEEFDKAKGFMDSFGAVPAVLNRAADRLGAPILGACLKAYKVVFYIFEGVERDQVNIVPKETGE